MTVAERLSQLAVNHDGFVFDPSTGDSYVLNPTGLVVLQGLQDAVAETQIAQNLAEQFDVTEDRAQRDISDFVSRLRTLHMI
jgi:PqqD family protein of HPr-rel-A system